MKLSFLLQLLATLATLTPVPPHAAGGQQAGGRGAPELEPLVHAWRASQGRAWRQITDAKTGYVEMLYGGSAPAPFRPRSDEAWQRLAASFLGRTEALHGAAASTLIHDRTEFLPFAQFGSTDKMAVHFRQVVNGVPVVGGSVNVLMDAQSGALLSVQSRALPDVEGAATQPLLEAGEAAALAELAFEQMLGARPDSVSQAELVFAQLEDASSRRAVLAWQVDLRAEVAGAPPEVWRHWIDARDGALLDSENLVHSFDVGGTIRANATPNTLPDTGGNPPQPEVQPHMLVSSSVGSTLADVNGNFNYPGVNGPITCTFTYVGPFALVTNAAGGDYALTLNLSGTGNAVLMNPAPNQFDTAQANAYDGINALRNWIRSVIPTDGTADFQALANCNIAASCGAHFDGGSVNFFAAGGPCVNMAYSTVIAHEMGHWLNVKYDTGNGSDGMGEGNADVFAMYLYDNPIVGENFCGGGCHVRTGNNDVQYCGDCCPGCHGGTHADGQVWMGAAWKVRRNLNTTHGDATGDALADVLFLGWMNAYDQTQIHSIIEAQWLTLDDDDGFIENGTPNYLDIDAGFCKQGFPGYDLPPCFGETYCVAAPNSVGPGAQISFSGSLSAGQNDTALHVAAAPPGELGLFYYGTNQTQVPFGNGFRCVGGSTFRLPIVSVSGGGTADWSLDITAPPQPAGEITGGSTWNFQFWYRDPSAGGANFNLSNAASLTFCN